MVAGDGKRVHCSQKLCRVENATEIVILTFLNVPKIVFPTFSRSEEKTKFKVGYLRTPGPPSGYKFVGTALFHAILLISDAWCTVGCHAANAHA